MANYQPNPIKQILWLMGLPSKERFWVDETWKEWKKKEITHQIFAPLNDHLSETVWEYPCIMNDCAKKSGMFICAFNDILQCDDYLMRCYDLLARIASTMLRKCRNGVAKAAVYMDI